MEYDPSRRTAGTVCACSTRRGRRSSTAATPLIRFVSMLDGLEGGCDSWSIPGQMPVGDYIVEVIPPSGYEILKPEDKNVDFGDQYNPAPALLPAPCVGDPHLVPDYLTLFPDEMIPAPFAGTQQAAV